MPYEWACLICGCALTVLHCSSMFWINFLLSSEFSGLVLRNYISWLPPANGGWKSESNGTKSAHGIGKNSKIPSQQIPAPALTENLNGMISKSVQKRPTTHSESATNWARTTGRVILFIFVVSISMVCNSQLAIVTMIRRGTTAHLCLMEDGGTILFIAFV